MALGLTYSHSAGGHNFYRGERHGKPCKVTVASHSAPFGPDLIKSMAAQANATREEFYGATRKTAKKIR